LSLDERPPGYLVLEDGTVYEGKLFGSMEETDGEVVFNTGMVGYIESLTDPSYSGEILTFTYPMIGNYGVPDKNRFESDGIKVRGAVISDLIDPPSHWESVSSLHDWFKASGVTGISGIDTRALTKRLREKGTMLGRILKNSKKYSKVEDPNATDLVGDVTIDKVTEKDGKGPHIVLVDCGCKESITSELIKRGCRVTRVPYDHPLNDMECDGILISNGPGDPEVNRTTIENVKLVINTKDPKPVGGICLGNQIIALAAGARTFKLPFGHRSQNQPCHEMGTKHCVITSQNHGYAVDRDSLPEGWEVWYENLNDGTVEGIKHSNLPFMAVQFHPEANPGPTDPNGFFDVFLEVVKDGQ
jgi:carbamoyl-phosphate synthase small subunit